MLRLTLILCAAIWLIFALGPDPEPRATETLAVVGADAEVEEEISRIVLESGEAWEIDRVITPEAPEAPPVASVTPEAQPEEAAEQATEAPAGPELALLYVTGTRVNLRAGPSTDNAIVTALTQGTEVELLAEASDGWLEIRDLATGAEGFMSGDFLSPDAP